MRTREPEPLPLILRDRDGETVLSVAGSNQGEPYRETLLLTFERGGRDDDAGPIACVELEPDEETALRELLNARFRRRLRNGLAHLSEPASFLVTDFDRINGRGVHADAGAAMREAQTLSEHYPGNAVHVLGTVAIAASGTLRKLIASPDAAEEVAPRIGEGPAARALADLALHLRTLITYARWQLEEGPGHHPTLRSAIDAAGTALRARGLEDFPLAQRALENRLRGAKPETR